MMGRLALAAIVLAVAAALASSCTQPRVPAPEPTPAPAPAPTPTANADSAAARSIDAVGVADPGSTPACATTRRIALDADSVALRFTAAFLKVGILPIRLSLPSVDGVTAGPVDVAVPAPARISARATTEMRNDSTEYRVEVRVGPTGEAWAAGDSATATAHAASMCARVEGLAFPTAG